MITSLSPLDGRYEDKVKELSDHFSEFALIRKRIEVEIRFLLALSEEKGIPELPAFTQNEVMELGKFVMNFDEKEAKKVKTIEKKTNHDVKAVEYYIRKKLDGVLSDQQLGFVHFACTSEDINNLSIALMLKDGMKEVMEPTMNRLIQKIETLAKQWSAEPMLALTHGQPATPTTVGKELRIFEERLKRQMGQLESQEYLGKLNGASGNFNAHVAAYPNVNWPKLSQKFVKSVGLTPNPLTTQIEPHDFMAEIFDNLKRFSTILIDLNRDIWSYISRGVFKQKTVEGEVGSSTMPHKVNPIDFENSEGNLYMAIGQFCLFSEKLPMSRMQRDLTDSTIQRNFGVGMGHLLLACKSILKGLGKLELDEEKTQEELDGNWELMAEPIQTVMRKCGVPNAYEKLKKLTRGKKMDRETMQAFVQSLEIPKEDKDRLLALTPGTYIGLAKQLANS